MAPLTFLREMACVDERLRAAEAARVPRTSRPLPGDGWSHHPYSLDLAPWQPDPRPDNVRMADLDRLTSLLHRLHEAGRTRDGPAALPHRVRLSDRPARPDVGRHARRPGALAARGRADRAPQAVAAQRRRSSSCATCPSGPARACASAGATTSPACASRTAAPKPAHASFALPLVARRAAPGRRALLGPRAPRLGQRAPQHRVREPDGRWRAIARPRTRRDGTFDGRAADRRRADVPPRERRPRRRDASPARAEPAWRCRAAPGIAGATGIGPRRRGGPDRRRRIMRIRTLSTAVAHRHARDARRGARRAGAERAAGGPRRPALLDGRRDQGRGAADRPRGCAASCGSTRPTARSRRSRSTRELGRVVTLPARPRNEELVFGIFVAEQRPHVQDGPRRAQPRPAPARRRQADRRAPVRRRLRGPAQRRRPRLRRQHVSLQRRACPQPLAGRRRPVADRRAGRLAGADAHAPPTRTATR